VFMDINVDREPRGRITVELFPDVPVGTQVPGAPATCLHPPWWHRSAACGARPKLCMLQW